MKKKALKSRLIPLSTAHFFPLTPLYSDANLTNPPPSPFFRACPNYAVHDDYPGNIKTRDISAFSSNLAKFLNQNPDIQLWEDCPTPSSIQDPSHFFLVVVFFFFFLEVFPRPKVGGLKITLPGSDGGGGEEGQ